MCALHEFSMYISTVHTTGHIITVVFGFFYKDHLFLKWTFVWWWNLGKTKIFFSCGIVFFKCGFAVLLLLLRLLVIMMLFRIPLRTPVDTPHKKMIDYVLARSRKAHYITFNLNNPASYFITRWWSWWWLGIIIIIFWNPFSYYSPSTSHHLFCVYFKKNLFYPCRLESVLEVRYGLDNLN